MKKICLICRKRLAVNIPPFGWLPCDVCRKRHQEIAKPKRTGEVTTDQIKEDRKIYRKDLIQPFKDGHLSREFAEAYPEKVQQMVKEGNITTEEVQSARDVWDLDYYKR